MDIHLLYNDRHFLICEKPVGVHSESDGLPLLLKEQENLIVYPVHRLDSVTGGTCLLAKTREACSKLQDMFHSGMMEKEYLAVVSGKPDMLSGTYTDFLYHHAASNKTFVVKKQRRGVKKALCDWQVLQSSDISGQLLSLVRIHLHTGRTHQIRVQFSSRRMPVVGDQKYGSRVKAKAPALWSVKLSFPHPFEAGRHVDALSFPPRAFPWSCFDIGSFYQRNG